MAQQRTKEQARPTPNTYTKIPRMNVLFIRVDMKKE